MGCDDCREALSARLDGAELPGERAATDGHLAGCPGCRQWYERAAAVTRLTRIAPAPPVPDPPDRLVAAVRAATPAGGGTDRTRTRLATACRVLLGLVGAGQVLVAVAQVAAPQVSSMPMHGGMPAGLDGASARHLLHESAAWNLALGAGFLYIAWRRTRPAALVPVLTAFVAALTVLSASDYLSGLVAWSRLAGHALLLAGYVLVVLLSRPAVDPGGPPVSGGTRRPRRWRLATVADPAQSPARRIPVRRLPPARARRRPAA
jgi:predicted anti-sigma-YlaC factor YlaD